MYIFKKEEFDIAMRFLDDFEEGTVFMLEYDDGEYRLITTHKDEQSNLGWFSKEQMKYLMQKEKEKHFV